MVFYVVVTELVRQLLEKSANVQCVTNTLDTTLHASVAGNKPDITQMLIKAGEINILIPVFV